MIYHRQPGIDIYHGDCLDILPTLPAKSVQCCVTSPPYWQLRDYGEEGQLGLEPTPEEYTANLVDVFRLVWRVLRDDGTLWLVIGDTHNSGECGARDSTRWPKQASNDHAPKRPLITSVKRKDLVGIPWRVAFALQADGWYLRSDIIWHKPGPMPESMTDRCTTSHEYIFLLTKSAKYHYDHEAIKEPATYAGQNRGGSINRYEQQGAGMDNRVYDTRNKRDVWSVQPIPCKLAHFATFPPKLIEPCILAGTSDHGCCQECGAPWKRIVERTAMETRTSKKGQAKHDAGLRTSTSGTMTKSPTAKTTGWESTCKCSFLRLRDDVPAAIMGELRLLGLV